MSKHINFAGATIIDTEGEKHKVDLIKEFHDEAESPIMCEFDLSLPAEYVIWQSPEYGCEPLPVSQAYLVREFTDHRSVDEIVFAG